MKNNIAFEALVIIFGLLAGVAMMMVFVSTGSIIALFVVFLIIVLMAAGATEETFMDDK